MTQEILIGVERRRRWSDERKLAILSEVGVDGASVSDVVRRHDLTRQHLYQWRTSFRQRLSSPDQSVAFVPVASVTTPAVTSGDGPDALAIVLRNGRSIRVTGHPAEDLLARVIQIAEDGMIGVGNGVRVYLACGVTDMRKGISGLAALAQDVLRQNPTSGALFAFRGRRGDRIKLLMWDGQGFCLYYKVLEKGRFPWPSPAEGVARLTTAQMAMLWEGMEWRRPSWSAPPSRVA